jgi:hypothetical protein
MWIKVPGGILLMGAVLGVSKGLQRELGRLVESAIAPPKNDTSKKRPPPKTKKKK